MRVLRAMLLTSLTNEELVFYMFTEEGERFDQYSFLLFICNAIRKGFLVAGDILIMDNARIHGGNDSIECLSILAQVYGITIIRLPTYSPELNVCELVFSFMKCDIYRNGVPPGYSLKDAVKERLKEIDFIHMLNWYSKCINRI